MNGIDDRTGDVHEAVGSYVVHALDESERREFEEHLATCASCQREIADMNDTLAALTAPFEVAPPAALRTSVLSAIAQVSQLPADDTVNGYDAIGGRLDAYPDEPRHAAAIVPPAGQDEPSEVRPTTPADEQLAPVVSLADARRRRTPRVLIAVAAAVALIAIAAGGWAVNLNQRLQNQEAGQVAAQQVAQRETELLRAPDAKIYTAKLNGQSVSYVVSKQRNAALLLSGNVPNPGAGKVYQIWTVQNASGTKAVYTRDATFGSGSQQRIFITNNVDKADLLAISVEPAGTAPAAPTTPAMAVAQV